MTAAAPDRWRSVPPIEARNVREIIIHHTASPPSTTVEQIDEWHRARGWTGIGYHFLVRHDAYRGRWIIERGRPLDRMGAHVQGRNGSTIGIAVAGDWTDVPSIRPTAGESGIADAVATAALAIHDAARALDAAALAWHVRPHRDVASPSRPTRCPGDFPWKTARDLAVVLLTLPHGD